MTESVFVVSRNPFIRDLCRRYLGIYTLLFCSDWNKLYDSLTQNVPRLILLDYSLIVFSGPQPLEEFCSSSPPVPVLVVTHVDCSFFTKWFFELGIKQVIHFPCQEEKIRKQVEDYLDGPAQSATAHPLPLPSCPKLERLLGDSCKMTKLKNTIYQYSQTDTPLLLTGESGTGKTYLAQIIHELSPRRENPFCSVNMTSIPISLAEAEFFGTTKGAYTDAVSREGYFSAAQTGTLFLDEIGDLPISIQPKLLHVLEEQSYSKVGSPQKIACDTRFIFATNADLQRLVDQGLFRSDLFYRISILPIEVPPLRERKTDIPQLAQHFLKPYKKDLSSSSIQKLMEHHWPGNVRELKNCLVRASILSAKEMIHDGCISF